MSRPLRVEYAGGVYHVSARGAGVAPIFSDDEDRERFVAILQRVADRYHLLFHAYCLLNDDYHLLLETPEGNLSRAMRQINGVYGQYLSRRHRRRGPILAGRFKSQVIEKDSYLEALARYVVLLPVREKLVAGPSHWRWSSYRATAGEDPIPSFLAAGWLLARMGGETLSDARKKYRAFVRKGLEEEAPSAADLEGSPILGRPAFEEALRPCLHDRESLRRVEVIHCSEARPPLEELLCDCESRSVRNARICEAHRRHGYTMKAIADQLNLHHSTVSRIVTAEEN